MATSEVSALISEFPGFADINVYGVSVPHCEGRAGMASVTLHNGTTLDWEALHTFLCECHICHVMSCHVISCQHVTVLGRRTCTSLYPCPS